MFKDSGPDELKSKYMGSVKIGPKGQIVIPKDVREMFGLKPGDTLMLLADADRGIAMNKMDFFNAVADTIFGGKREDDPELVFAEGVENITGKEEEK